MSGTCQERAGTLFLGLSNPERTGFTSPTRVASRIESDDGSDGVFRLGHCGRHSGVSDLDPKRWMRSGVTP